MDELRPCPFCGGEAHVVGKPHEAVFCVGCGDDTCLGFSGLGWLYGTEEEAAAAWNRRAERTCRMVNCGSHDTCVVNRELSNGNIVSMEFGYKQCSECGANVFDCPTVRYCPNCGSRVVTADGDR